MTYTIDSYIDAMISAVEFEKAVPELRGWHAARLEALREAIVRRLGKSPEVDQAGIYQSMLKAAITRAASVAHPFAGWLECPDELYELIQPHAVRLTELASETERECRALAKKLLLHVQPALEAISISSDELRAVGFDDASEPDEFEYF